MGVIALASYKNGTMNLPKEVKEKLGLPKQGKLLFVEENGKIYIQGA